MPHTDCDYCCAILQNQGSADIYEKAYNEWHGDISGNAQ